MDTEPAERAPVRPNEASPPSSSRRTSRGNETQEGEATNARIRRSMVQSPERIYTLKVTLARNACQERSKRQRSDPE